MAERQLSKLDRPVQNRIKTYLQNIAELKTPTSKGKALQGNFAKYWRYRVGDYRLICQIKNSELIIVVVKIGHRREVYKR